MAAIVPCRPGPLPALTRARAPRCDRLAPPARLSEVMRYLIAGDDVAVAILTRQGEFFATHLQPWAAALFERRAMLQCSDAC